MTVLNKCFCLEVTLCMLERLLKTRFWITMKTTNDVSITIHAFTLCAYAKVKYINISKSLQLLYKLRYHYIHQLSKKEQSILLFFYQ